MSANTLFWFMFGCCTFYPLAFVTMALARLAVKAAVAARKALLP